MSWKHIAAGAALALALSEKAYAQSTVEAAPASKETKTIRLSDSYKDVSGFIDIYGRSPRVYSEIYLRHNMRGKSGPQLEFNGGSGMDSVYRAGYAADIPMPKNIKLVTKFLPVTATKNGVKKEAQFGVFGSIEGKGFYLENFTDYTVSKGKRPLVSGEFTGGKYVTKNIGLQGQAAYNLNSPGWVFRVGGRLKIF